MSEKNYFKRYYKCDVCLKAFSRKAHVTRHKNIHLSTKPYNCEICAKAFTRQDLLRKHTRTHDKDDGDSLTRELLRPHKCDVCSKQFTRRTHLTRHKFIHLSTKPYICENFASPDQLKKHARQIHDIDDDSKTVQLFRPHKCNVCSKGFTNKSHLTRHIKYTCSNEVRTDPVKPSKPEPSFSCYLCSKSFERRDLMDKHFTLHMKGESLSKRILEYQQRMNYNTGEQQIATDSLLECKIELSTTGPWLEMDDKLENVHECKICLKTFSRKNALNKHSVVHTGIRAFNCKHCSMDFARQDHLRRHERTHSKPI